MIIGGAQENTLSTVIGLKNLGHQVCLISGPSKGPEGSMEPDIKSNRIDLITVRELVRDISPWHDVVAFFKLGMIFRKNRYDIIHTHSAKAGFLGRIAARIFSRKSKIVHTLHGSSFYSYQPALVRFVYLISEKIAGFCTDYFISVSSVILEKHIKAGIGKNKKSSVVRSGFNTEEYREVQSLREKTRKRFNIGEKEILIGMIGRLSPMKGQEYLLKVFAGISYDYPHIHLVLVGDGILRKAFEKFVEKNSLEGKVHFTGLVKPSHIPAYASAMDIGVHTSLREGLPRAVVQILATGSPVIAFDVDGAKEVIKNGMNGFLVPAEDEVSLEEKIRYLIEHPEARKKMGENGRKMVMEEFSVGKMVAETEKIYFNIAGKNNSCKPGYFQKGR